jgi:hypothetical protein
MILRLIDPEAYYNILNNKRISPECSFGVYTACRRIEEFRAQERGYATSLSAVNITTECYRIFLSTEHPNAPHHTLVIGRSFPDTRIRSIKLKEVDLLDKYDATTLAAQILANIQEVRNTIPPNLWVGLTHFIEDIHNHDTETR